MNYGQALSLIGGLSQPSKMPWWGWSISAKDCITGSRLAKVEGTTCSGCYALKGRYLFGQVVTAHSRRRAAMDDPRFVDAFVMVLENLFAKTRKRKEDGQIENRFRWLDSGDLQSLDMLRMINEIALRTPQIAHWLPTRELGIVRAFEGEFSSNLIVRMSNATVGVTPRQQPFGLSYSTVGCDEVEGVKQCRAAADQGNRCLDCDACWHVGNINYPLH